MTRSRPDLQDLYQLADQVERDRELSIDALKRRDHALASSCEEQSEQGRLLHWLDCVAPDGSQFSRRESRLALAARAIAFVVGFVAMAGFLLGSGRGLVNVFILVPVFVLLQLLMSLVSAGLLLRTVTGRAPATLPASPARWIAMRSLPDGRYLREANSVLRLVFLRYGQEWGALFSAAALLAFVILPALNDFGFVWGSTFQVSDALVLALTDTLASPWSTIVPGATVSPEVISSSRYHPALINLDRAGIDSMRGWWGFLFMCMAFYALLPRILLWLCARYFSSRLMRRSFLQFPGADLVLSRMRAPLVTTQGAQDKEGSLAASGTGRGAVVGRVAVPADQHLLLLDWSGALGTESPQQFEELLAVAADKVLRLGLSDLQHEQQILRDNNGATIDHLLVAVKSWEPPMAELSDLLSELDSVPRCTIYLVPLPGKSVPHRKVEDWRHFVRQQSFASVDVRILNRVESA